MIRANDRRSVFSREIGSDVSRNDARLFVPRAQCTSQRVNDTPFHFVHHFVGKILKSERGGITGELMSKCCLHAKVAISICRRIRQGQATPPFSAYPVRLASFAQGKLRRVEGRRLMHMCCWLR